MTKKGIPFLLSSIGVLFDYITTRIGLNLGLYETHSYYHPLLALLVFWGAVAVLVTTLPDKKPWTLGINGLAVMSFLGGINNTLVIFGVFHGLVITF